MKLTEAKDKQEKFNAILIGEVEVVSTKESMDVVQKTATEILKAHRKYLKNREQQSLWRTYCG